MLDGSAQKVLELVDERALILDVGGWARPFPRADWVIDLQPYATRGLYLYDRATAQERFTAQTWVVRDICAAEPWPFADRQFDFAICAQTLEDVRDPLRVCSELIRVAKRGYVEVPSRLEEQSLGVDGRQWAGWGHHRWLCDVGSSGIQFVFKPHHLHARADLHFTAEFHARLSPEQRVACLWWNDSFAFSERIFVDAAEFDAYLREVVAAREGADAGAARRWARRVLRRGPVS